jgi:hypothetical protein
MLSQDEDVAIAHPSVLDWVSCFFLQEFEGNLCVNSRLSDRSERAQTADRTRMAAQ